MNISKLFQKTIFSLLLFPPLILLKARNRMLYYSLLKKSSCLKHSFLKEFRDRKKLVQTINLSLFLAIFNFPLYASNEGFSQNKIRLSLHYDSLQKTVKSCSSSSLVICTLQLPIFIPKTLTITNNSSTATALNIRVKDIPDTSNISQNASLCAQLGPQANCQILLIGQPPLASYVVHVGGDNTASVEIMLDVINPP